jgi:hypothetical protein
VDQSLDGGVGRDPRRLGQDLFRTRDMAQRDVATTASKEASSQGRSHTGVE